MQRHRNRPFPKPIDYVLLAIIGLCLLAYAWMALPASAQPSTLTFSASTTTGDGSVVPVLTWSTSPPAQSCTASGAANWTGPKAASGAETLAAIASSATYNLECTWPGDSIATLTWTNPTSNEDGSPYTDRKATVVRHAFAADPRAQGGIGGVSLPSLMVPPAGGGAVQLEPAFTMHTVTGLTQVGEQRFTAYACNQRDVCSAASNVAMKAFTGSVRVTESVGITVNPIPGAITGLGAE